VFKDYFASVYITFRGL